MLSDRLITVAIHTYSRAHQLKAILESEGIMATLQNVNLTNPTLSAGVRVRIRECDLPQALRIIENIEIFTPAALKAANLLGEILVPVDFSECSLRAACAAFQIAAAHGSSVHLLHTFADPSLPQQAMGQLTDDLSFDMGNDEVEEATEEHTVARVLEDEMKKFTDHLREKIKDGVIPAVKFTHEITEGLPEEVIDDYATSHKILLIVMGTRGTDTQKRELLGSVTAEVLDACRTSVLTIPDNRAFNIDKMASVVFFTASRQDDILALDTFHRLFADTPLSITLVALPTRFVSGNPESLDNLLKYCRQNYPAYTFSASPLSLANPVDDFEKIVANHPVDLILTASRRKNIFARLFNPSLAHRLLFRADVALMSIPVQS